MLPLPDKDLEGVPEGPIASRMRWQRTLLLTREFLLATRSSSGKSRPSLGEVADMKNGWRYNSVRGAGSGTFPSPPSGTFERRAMPRKRPVSGGRCRTGFPSPARRDPNPSPHGGSRRSSTTAPDDDALPRLLPSGRRSSRRRGIRRRAVVGNGPPCSAPSRNNPLGTPRSRRRSPCRAGKPFRSARGGRACSGRRRR